MKAGEERLLRELAEALHSALANAVGDARGTHAGEHFYAYILYTLPLFDYAVLLFNTEEGLARIAHNKKQRDEIRWSPADWECARDAEKAFERVNELLGLLVQRQRYEEAHWSKRREVFIDVLKLLDAQGVFGTGAARETAVVNIMWGDQDVRAHIESARELNPRTSYLEYARHELPSLHAWAKETEASPSMYNDDALAHIHRTIAQVESDLAAWRAR
jgi:hypothetical protein